jgi:plasmid stabilization system protein ParE
LSTTSQIVLGSWLGILNIGRSRNDLGLGLRSLIVGEYVILHRLEPDETVWILNVVHGSRDIAAVLRR